jgi:hypothetical protein
MRLLLRWLAFFVIGDAVMGILLIVATFATMLVVWPIKHAMDAFSMAGLDLALAWRIFLAQLDWGWAPFDATVGIPIGIIVWGESLQVSGDHAGSPRRPRRQGLSCDPTAKREAPHRDYRMRGSMNRQRDLSMRQAAPPRRVRRSGSAASARTG